MRLSPFHGYAPDLADRVALVAVEPSADRQLQLIQVSRGPTKQQLRPTEVRGPYEEAEIPRRFEEVVAELRTEGYWPGGVLALLEQLEQPQPAGRARAALRLGWRRCPEAVEKIISLLPQTVDESCSFLDALGMIADVRAVPVLREYAARKLLSRRRSAVEALRRIGDSEGLNEAHQRALERLPDNLRQQLGDNSSPIHVAALAETLLELEAAPQGLALDTLYEIGTPATVQAVWKTVPQLRFDQPFVWRAIKSIFKRAQLRHDYITFGWLYYLIETTGRLTKGSTAQVKSGYDGSERATPIFSRKTQNFLRRSAWRYLRELARYRPESYAPAAAEVLIHCTPEFVQQQGAGRCYLLHRILFGSSKRFRFDDRKMTFRLRSWKLSKPPAGVREESFPDLWDQQPRAYLRLLSAAHLPQVQVFAFTAVQARHAALIREASAAEIIGMLQAPHEPTVELALAELDRRFDPRHPNWDLLHKLLLDERPQARTIGQRWLRLTAHLWLQEPDRILDFLGIPQQNLRALVVEAVVGYLRPHAELRQTLAPRLLTILNSPEAFPGEHTGYAAVVQEVLTAEFARLITVSELADLLAGGSDAVKIMASELLRRRPDAAAELGLERLAALAQHELAAVRSAAFALIRSAVPHLRQDPSILFLLAESDWEDARSLAFELLQEKIDVAALGLDGLLGLLDSTRAAVQDVGKALTLKHLPQLSAAELIRRLCEHPHPNMRPFALELAVQYLPQSRESLAQLRGFCRSALFDLWPDRAVKHLVIDFLAARAVEDAAQAEVAAAILGDVVRVQGRDDFERALQALVRIRLAHPELPSTVQLVPGGVE